MPEDHSNWENEGGAIYEPDAASDATEAELDELANEAEPFLVKTTFSW